MLPSKEEIRQKRNRQQNLRPFLCIFASERETGLFLHSRSLFRVPMHSFVRLVSSPSSLSLVPRVTREEIGEDAGRRGESNFPIFNYSSSADKSRETRLSVHQSPCPAVCLTAAAVTMDVGADVVSLLLLLLLRQESQEEASHAP